MYLDKSCCQCCTFTAVIQVCYLEQQPHCFINFQVRNMTMCLWVSSMDTSVTISACDNDIPMSTVWEIVAKIKLYVVCIGKQKQPLLIQPRKPVKGILV